MFDLKLTDFFFIEPLHVVASTQSAAAPGLPCGKLIALFCVLPAVHVSRDAGSGLDRENFVYTHIYKIYVWEYSVKRKNADEACLY